MEFYFYTERANSRSNNPHKGAKLASYKGDPFVAGGTWHRKVEILNWSKDTGNGYKSDKRQCEFNIVIFIHETETIVGWEYVDDFPSDVRGSIFRYAAVSTSTRGSMLTSLLICLPLT